MWAGCLFVALLGYGMYGFHAVSEQSPYRERIEQWAEYTGLSTELLAENSVQSREQLAQRLNEQLQGMLIFDRGRKGDPWLSELEDLGCGPAHQTQLYCVVIVAHSFFRVRGFQVLIDFEWNDDINMNALFIRAAAEPFYRRRARYENGY